MKVATKEGDPVTERRRDPRADLRLVILAAGTCGLLFDIGGVYWGVISDPIFQGVPLLIALPLLLLLGFAVLSLVLPTIWWRTLRWRSFLPIGAVVLTIALFKPAIGLGVALRDWFK